MNGTWREDVQEDGGARDRRELERLGGVRTDLAVEAHEVASAGLRGREIPGVRTEREDFPFGYVVRVDVESEEGGRLLGKLPGKYVTFHIPELRTRWREFSGEVAPRLAREIEVFLSSMGVDAGDPLLVVGLGNWNATPDNVGPLTVSKLLVTRHLHEYKVLPEELLGRMRPVAALSPGVLGITGVETAEVVRGVVEAIRPAAVICVDALASKSVERIGTTVQVADVGISPGSGVGNKRVGLTRETLGVPVLAIGVPTVIYATTIVSDALDALSAHWTRARTPSPAGSMLDPSRIVVTPRDRAPATHSGFDAGLLALSGEGRRELLAQVLGPSMGTLIVTPKEVDVLVDTLSGILADALNEALHPGISAEEAALLR